MTRDEIQQELRRVFGEYLGASPATIGTLVPETVLAGKLYEAYVLSLLVEKLVEYDNYSLTLVGGPKIQLKSSPGPINRKYPHIELRYHGNFVAELWTDVEFLSLSYCKSQTAATTKGDYHELDILIVEVGVTGRPKYDQVWLGVECKNTGYQKGLLKEILGIRRELSLLSGPTRTKFFWPRETVPATPPSCLLVYSTDEKVMDYSAPGEYFGIDFFHEIM
jgi:hypothetical protein